MDVFQKVKGLNLPKGKYVVFSGAALEGYGIRKSNDIDIAVTEDVYNDLKRRGWKQKILANGEPALQRNEFEILKCFRWGKYKASAKDLIKSAKIIKEVAFANLDEIIKFKTQMARKKDKKDIKLIEKYLKNASN